MERTNYIITNCAMNPNFKLHYESTQRNGLEAIYFGTEAFYIEDYNCHMEGNRINDHKYTHKNEITFGLDTDIIVCFSDGSDTEIYGATDIVIHAGSDNLTIHYRDDFDSHVIDYPVSEIDAITMMEHYSVHEVCEDDGYETYGDGSDLLRWRNRDLY